MYFITMFLKDGSKEHIGPFKDRQQGIDYAQAAIKTSNELNGRWSNERMYKPNLDILND